MLKKVESKSIRATVLLSILFASVAGMNCGGEPDGLSPDQVMQGFLQAVAQNDESKARNFVTFKSKLLVAVGMKLITAAEQSPENAETKEVDEFRKDLDSLAAGVKCDEPAENAEMVECTLASQDAVKFPLVKTSDGWRIDLFTMIEKSGSDVPVQGEPEPAENPGA
ncbi:MAG: hypothetical protein CMF59_16795 [Leptospiraceae bacterium]|nr:hypothetical protein [Leptospiraceae bacterium]